MKKHVNDYKRLGDNIRKRRQENHLTQAELARLASCPASTISSLKDGRCGISVELLFGLARALKCRGTELVKGV